MKSTNNEVENIILQMKELCEEEDIEWNEDFLNVKNRIVPFGGIENLKFFYILLGRLIEIQK